MNCSGLDLSAYVDGELAPAQEQIVEAHCATCPACSEELADLRALTTALLAAPAPPVRAQAVEQAVHAARAAVRRPSLWHMVARFWRARVAIPAPALALGLAVALLITSSAGPGLEPTRLRVTVIPGRRPAARQAVYEEWRDAGELWEQPVTPVSTEKMRVLYHESVRL